MIYPHSEFKKFVNITAGIHVIVCNAVGAICNSTQGSTGGGGGYSDFSWMGCTDETTKPISVGLFAVNMHPCLKIIIAGKMLI